MILYSSRKLEKALADGKLETWAKVKYLIIPVVLGSLASPFYVIRPRYGARVPTLDSFVSMLCSFLIAYITYRGIKRCFNVNQNIDNKAFFERFAVLSLPPLIRMIVIAVPLSIIIVFGAATLRERFPILLKQVSLFTAILGPAITYVLYSMIRNSFQRLGELIKKEEPNSSNIKSLSFRRWSSSFMTIAIISTLIMPIVGVIIGIHGVSEIWGNRKQGKILLIIGSTLTVIYISLFFLFFFDKQAVKSLLLIK